MDDNKTRLSELGRKIDNLRAETSEDNARKDNISATKLSVELVSGVIVGCFIGYYLDKWLNTSPIFFIICFFLGVAAGALNIYKLARNQDNTPTGEAMAPAKGNYDDEDEEEDN